VAGLRIFVSNRMEILADRLAETLSRAPDDPLAEEIIVVQSAGMQRWVSMSLAARNGICTNVRFPFPKAFLREILSSAGPAAAVDERLEPDVLAWRIHRILGRLDKRPVFAPVRDYLAADAGAVRRFELASHLAHLFDQYLVFRPDKVLQWEEGGPLPAAEACQAEIWRMLGKDCGGVSRHLPAARKEFVRRLREMSRAVPSGLPGRVCLFGISYLPRQYLEIFHAASSLVETNFFLLNPSREFWMDIRSGREIGRMRERRAEEEGTAGQAFPDYWETGNALLASFGAMGRDFFNALMEYDAEVREDFAETDAGGILGEIQNDILYLRDRPLRNRRPSGATRPSEGERGTPGLSGESAVSPAGDSTLQVHSCHSPMREVEVLYDRLLGMFDEDPRLKPSDILVMAPDISIYAPFIRAVFEFPSGPTDAVRIPYGIADRGILGRSPAVRAFFGILSLQDSRFEVSRVLDILEEPAVHRRFELSESDLEVLRRWTDDAAIRWGIDAEHRRRLGLPLRSENTWRAGLERLLLGYAMMGNGRDLFQGIAPSPPVEGDDAVLLGRFVEFVESLFRTTADLASPRSLAAWGEFLSEVLSDFFHEERDGEEDVRLLQTAFRKLGHLQQASGNDDPVDLQTVRSQLERALGTGGSASGYLARGVTFCSLLPMRSIPAAVICLLGMNYADYPRKDTEAGLNLMAASPRPGDRSKRGEDRYLFLEALLSARRRLYISYIGRSIEDNSPIPPSVLVSELLDYIDAGFSGPADSSGDGGASGSLVVQHPLQAFSPSYFRGDGRLFSYSHENFEAARCLGDPCREPPPFIDGGLAERPAEGPEIDVAELAEFFANPARSFLEKRLGIVLPEDREPQKDVEPFDLAGLEKYRLEQALAGRAIEADGSAEGLYEYFRASGALPHGTAGRVAFEELASEIRRFSGIVKGLRGSSTPSAVAVDLPVGGRRLCGQVEDIFDAGLLSHRYGRLGPKDHLRFWVRHLALSAQDPGRVGAGGSVLLGRGEAWRYRAVDNPEDILEGLVSIYLEGRNKPIHFFPDSSWEYACRRVRQEPPGEALRCARRIWSGNDFAGGEEDQPHIGMCFRNMNPLDASFADLAERILRPLLGTAERIDGVLQAVGSSA